MKKFIAMASWLLVCSVALSAGDQKKSGSGSKNKNICVDQNSKKDIYASDKKDCEEKGGSWREQQHKNDNDLKKEENH